jgi:hypothetical protein
MSSADKADSKLERIKALLKEHDKWISCNELVQIVAEDFRESGRQAHRDLKRAVKKDIIKKYALPDRHTVYGLDEFGPIENEEYISGKLEFRYIRPSREFLEARSIFDRLLRIARINPLSGEKFIGTLCTRCKKQIGKPLSLQNLCKPCDGNLYSKIEKILSPLLKDPEERERSIAFYLAYEYKILLYLIVYRQLKDGYFSMKEKEWVLLATDQLERLRRLNWTDASLEPKLNHYFPQLIQIDNQNAEKVIETLLNAVRWHLIDRTGEFNEDLSEKARKAREEFEDVAMPIVRKAFHLPCISKKIASLYKYHFGHR